MEGELVRGKEGGLKGRSSPSDGSDESSELRISLGVLLWDRSRGSTLGRSGSERVLEGLQHTWEKREKKGRKEGERSAWKKSSHTELLPPEETYLKVQLLPWFHIRARR